MTGCGVCGAVDVGAAGMFEHLRADHTAMVPAFRMWCADQDAVVVDGRGDAVVVEHADELAARAARYVADLGMVELVLDAIGADGRPCREPVIMRSSPLHGWVWCGRCGRVSREFDMLRHFGDRRHRDVFGPDVDKFELRVEPPPPQFFEPLGGTS